MVREKNVFFCLCFCHLLGVFGDELKSVSVMEGESVTLQSGVTDVNKMKRADLIKWTFGTNGILIAKISRESSEIPDDLDGRFRDRLKLDHQTGSLTITNTRTTDSGLYKVTISTGSSTKQIFTVTVTAATTTEPTSTSHSTSHPPSGSTSCLTSHPPSGSTSCPTSHPSSGSPSLTVWISAAAGFLLLVAAIVIFFIYRKHRKTDQQAEARDEDVIYTDTTFVKRNASRVKQEEDVVYAGVVTKR